MYIDHIEVQNFRTFRKSKISFCHVDRDFKEEGIPKPKLPNLNLLLADNGYGKTSLLKAIALTSLGPAVPYSGIFPYRLIRREVGVARLQPAVLKATFKTHRQDHSAIDQLESCVGISPQDDLELLIWTHPEGEEAWRPIFRSDSDAFFMVGYGASRRVARSSRLEPSNRVSPRAARVMGLFEEDYELRPLNSWLPKYEASRKLRGRAVQVGRLLNRLLGRGNWEFTGRQDKDNEYIFSNAGAEIPFPALSDGYRAFLGWLGDLLYHICETCPSDKKLVENKGIVMVDEIDLHLHPKWQMTVLKTLATELPNIQFIVTSHSPLLVGTLEWMNIILMRPGPKRSSAITQLEWAVHGLDADQVLLTDFFGLKSTRAPGKKRALKELALRARNGDAAAAKKVLEQMSRGMERG